MGNKIPYRQNNNEDVSVKSNPIKKHRSQFKYKKNDKYGNILVMGYMHQILEIGYKLIIPSEIKHIVYIFWGSWNIFYVGDIMDVRNRDCNIWYKGVIKQYIKPSEVFPADFESFICHTESMYIENVLRSTNKRKLEAVLVRPHCNNNAKQINNWKLLKIGDIIDARDRWGHWYLAQIKKHKRTSQQLAKQEIANLPSYQVKKINENQNFEGIYVHYLAWEQDKWDEWIFMKNGKTNILCECGGKCRTDKSEHRLSQSNAQSKYTTRYNQWIFIKDINTICYCNQLCHDKHHRVTVPNNHNQTMLQTQSLCQQNSD